MPDAEIGSCHDPPARFFLRDADRCANQSGILYALQTLCQQLGWQPRGDYLHHRLRVAPHLHRAQRLALRPAVHRRGPRRPAPSTYVGHAKVSDTYGHFTGIPELMSIAAERFHRYLQGDAQ